MWYICDLVILVYVNGEEKRAELDLMMHSVRMGIRLGVGNGLEDVMISMFVAPIE